MQIFHLFINDKISAGIIYNANLLYTQCLQVCQFIKIYSTEHLVLLQLSHNEKYKLTIYRKSTLI